MASHLPRLEKLDSLLTEVYKSNPLVVNVIIGYIILIPSFYFIRGYLSTRQKPAFGLPSTTSNISDQYKYSKDQKNGQAFKVKSLWVYPVKGCRGIEVTSSNICHTGLKFDRQLMFATCKPGTKDWSFASQRGFPKMAVIHTSIDPAKNTLTISYPTRSSFPASILYGTGRRKSFTIPLNVNLLSEKELAKYPLTNVEVWKQQSVGYSLSTHIPQELKDTVFAKSSPVDVGLFAVVDGKNRGIKWMGPPMDVLGRPNTIGFADFAPVHIVGLASVREFNELVKDEVPELSVLRFRPNIIVEGSPPYDEDWWKTIKIGSADFHVISRTPRCKVPNNDPETGERNRNEPDITIRAQRNIDPGAPKLGCMGMHMVPFDIDGVINVGDTIDVGERTTRHEWGRNLWEEEYPTKS